MVIVQPAYNPEFESKPPQEEILEGQIVYTEMGELLVSKLGGETVAVWAAGTWQSGKVKQS